MAVLDNKIADLILVVVAAVGLDRLAQLPLNLAHHLVVMEEVVRLPLSLVHLLLMLVVAGVVVTPLVLQAVLVVVGKGQVLLEPQATEPPIPAVAAVAVVLRQVGAVALVLLLFAIQIQVLPQPLQPALQLLP
jgi:hypothetical protein